MSLDLPHIIKQVQQFGEAASRRITMLQKQLPVLEQAFIQLEGIDSNDLETRLASTPASWHGAIPALDPLTGQFPPPKPIKEIDISAADGSQIYPDRHSPMLYYLINVGGIKLPYGSQRSPDTFSSPSLYYDPQDLYDAGRLVSASIINGRRDVAELSALADFVSTPSPTPGLSLLDNSLMLRLAIGEPGQITKTAHQLIKEYLQALSQIQKSGINLAGFIDRPGRTDLLNTIAVLTKQETSNIYPGLVDRDLMRQWLKPYHRSAIFQWKTPDFSELSRAGHGLHFFYLNLGRPDAIARIEIPRWVALEPIRVEQVHSGILRDGQATGGFPYSLVRAHELAVVTHHERLALEQWLLKNLVDRGLSMDHSQKAITKGWLGRPRRHRV